MDILKYVLNLIKDYWFFGGLPSSAELYLRVLVAFNVVFGLLILVMYFHQGFYTFFRPVHASQKMAGGEGAA